MNSYEQRLERRRERLERIAAKLKAEGDARWKRADEMASVIPFGQPMLVGHHSYNRDRRYRERIQSNLRKGFEALNASKDFAARAAAVGTGGISSDDPDAVAKLREELVGLEAKQAFMIAANKVVRAFWKAGVRDSASGELWTRYVAKLQELRPTVTEVEAGRLLQGDHLARIGFPDYATKNNGANIRRVKGRIEQLEARAKVRESLEAAGTPERETQCRGFKVVENATENRVQVIFPGKPSEVVRSILKRSGFRWSPTNLAWQRMLNAGVVQWLTREDGYLRKDLERALGVAS